MSAARPTGTDLRIVRLAAGDHALAQRLFGLMAAVFEEAFVPPGAAHLDRLLARRDLWVLAALEGGEPVGGVTAHVLPMTRQEGAELFLYDLAVRADRQRRGIGRALVQALRAAAAAEGLATVFLAADNEDTHALDFYRAIGGTPSPVTVFTFGPPDAPPPHAA